MSTFRIALAQINTVVGDLDGNTAKVIDYMRRARELGADLIAFPELAITGYPPEDLLFKSKFVEENKKRMHEVVAASKGISAVLGFVDSDGPLYNAAAIACDGELAHVYRKIYLPNYGVFDEERYFKPGNRCPVFKIGEASVGINICEDIWHTVGPTVVQKSAGAELIVNISASPFYTGKIEAREEMLATRASENCVYVAYLNLVGGQDELVFDGASIIHDPLGDVVEIGSQFQEELVVSDLDLDMVRNLVVGHTQISVNEEPVVGEFCIPEVISLAKIQHVPKVPIPSRSPTRYDAVGEVYAALVIGTRDYVLKSGFKKVVIALSGGIDSSIVAAVAVDALGASNVTGVSMPSRYSSEGSINDAHQLSKNLGIEMKSIPIEEAFASSLRTLESHFHGLEPDTAEENLQSRIRGNLIMAMSNKFGSLVLTTGNKSEIAVGYATIYGDMAGAYAVIKDVPKTMVYDLARYRNGLSGHDVIPEAVLIKPPSAELRPDQTDQDSLPPYEILDPILTAYVEEDCSLDDIVALGFDREVVQQVATLVDRSEYKRRQAPPGVKITPRNFGRDRRMPIVNRYKPF